MKRTKNKTLGLDIVKIKEGIAIMRDDTVLAVIGSSMIVVRDDEWCPDMIELINKYHKRKA